MESARFRFTKQSIHDLVPGPSRRYYYDQLVSALAVLVTPSGAKSFYLIKKHKGVYHRERIGSVTDVPIERARAMASELLSKIMSGQAADQKRLAAGGRLLLQDVFDEYMEHARAHRRTGTVDEYQREWDVHLKDWAGSRPLKSIRRREISALHLQIGEDNGHHMANRVIAFLRAVIARAIREHELEIANAAQGLTFFKELKRSRRLQADEIPAFLQAVRDEPNSDLRDFLLVALFTGVRKANLLAMQWQHLSLDRGLWIVPADEAKAGEELPVVLPRLVVEILTDRQARAEGPYVFPGRRGAVHMTNPNVGWIRILKRAGLENLRMHDLRRSLASFQIDTGTPLEVIQKTLGHGSLATTQIYARMAMEPVRESVERAVEEILKKAETTR